MYSVVLMMALTSGTETPTLFKRGCNSCSGWSCRSSCSSRCHGCNSCHSRKKLFGGRKCHGCNSSCRGCHGCHASACHGCHAPKCHGCHVSACTAAACHGCGAAAPAPAPAAKPMPAPDKKAPEPVKKPKAEDKESSLNAPATIIVSLPAEAKLFVDDFATTSTTANRVFVSTALEGGKDYFYTLTATVNDVTVSKKVTVRAGEETRVTLELPVASVAAN